MIPTNTFRHKFEFKLNETSLKRGKTSPSLQTTPVYTRVENGVTIHFVQKSPAPQEFIYGSTGEANLQQALKHQSAPKEEYLKAEEAYYRKRDALISKASDNEQVRLREFDKTARKATSEIHNDLPTPGRPDLEMKKEAVDALLEISRQNWSQLGSDEHVSELRTLDKAHFYCELDVKIEEQESKIRETKHHCKSSEAANERLKLAKLQHLKAYQQHRDKVDSLTQNKPEFIEANREAENLLWFRWYNDSLETAPQEAARTLNAKEEWKKFTDKPEELYHSLAKVFKFHTKREYEMCNAALANPNKIHGRLENILQGKNLTKSLGGGPMSELQKAPSSETNPANPLPGGQGAMFANWSPALESLVEILVRINLPQPRS